MKTYTLQQFKRFATEIEAYENGEKIEVMDGDKWVELNYPIFDLALDYRVKPKPTREEITANWVKENDLKIGDKVKVLMGFDRGLAGFDLLSAKEAIGSICEVAIIGKIWIRIAYNQQMYHFPVECLEKVKEEYIPFQAKDWNLFKNKWVKCGKELTDTISIQRINGINFDSENILIGTTWTLLKSAFSEYTFEDGAPFGKIKTL